MKESLDTQALREVRIYLEAAIDVAARRVRWYEEEFGEHGGKHNLQALLDARNDREALERADEILVKMIG